MKQKPHDSEKLKATYKKARVWSFWSSLLTTLSCELKNNHPSNGLFSTLSNKKKTLEDNEEETDIACLFYAKLGKWPPMSESIVYCVCARMESAIGFCDDLSLSQEKGQFKKIVVKPPNPKVSTIEDIFVFLLVHLWKRLRPTSILERSLASSLVPFFSHDPMHRLKGAVFQTNHLNER